MKKTIIAILVALALCVIGFLFYGFSDKGAEPVSTDEGSVTNERELDAPSDVNTQNENVSGAVNPEVESQENSAVSTEDAVKTEDATSKTTETPSETK